MFIFTYVLKASSKHKWRILPLSLYSVAFLRRTIAQLLVFHFTKDKSCIPCKMLAIAAALDTAIFEYHQY